MLFKKIYLHGFKPNPEKIGLLPSSTTNTLKIILTDVVKSI